jgi:hypothetical protein
VGGSFKRRDRTEWERERAKEEMEASTSSAAVARQTWEIENNIPMDTPSGDSDAIFEYERSGAERHSAAEALDSGPSLLQECENLRPCTPQGTYYS